MRTDDVCSAIKIGVVGITAGMRHPWSIPDEQSC